MPCSAMLCFAMLCYAVLCSAMLCCRIKPTTSAKNEIKEKENKIKIKSCAVAVNGRAQRSTQEGTRTATKKAISPPPVPQVTHWEVAEKEV